MLWGESIARQNELTLGDGQDDAGLVLDKGGSKVGAVEVRDAGVTRWTVGANASESLVVERFNTSGVKQDEPLQIDPSDGAVRGKLIHCTSHNFSSSSKGYTWVPFNAIYEQSSSSYYSIGTPAPYDGRLVKVIARSSNAWNTSSAFKLYVASSGSSSASGRGSWIYDTGGANTPLTYNMTSSSTFSAGERIQIYAWVSTSGSQNPFGDVRIIAVWEFDQTT